MAETLKPPAHRARRMWGPQEGREEEDASPENVAGTLLTWALGRTGIASMQGQLLPLGA